MNQRDPLGRVVLDLKRAFLGLARFAPLSTSSAFQAWRADLHLLRDVHEDLVAIERLRPGLLSVLAAEAHEAHQDPPPEISALIARYTKRNEAL